MSYDPYLWYTCMYKRVISPGIFFQFFFKILIFGSLGWVVKGQKMFFKFVNKCPKEILRCAPPVWSLFYKRTSMLCHSLYIFWLDRKCCGWNYCNIWTNTLRFIYIENVIRLVLFVVLLWPSKIYYGWWFFIFLFMVTSGGIIFICSAVDFVGHQKNPIKWVGLNLYSTSLIRKISNSKRYPVEKPSNEISSLESTDMLQSENFI